MMYVSMLKRYTAVLFFILAIQTTYSAEFGFEPIHTAASRGDLQALKKQLDRNVNINQPDKLGKTPLHRAVSKGHLNVVRYLLEQPGINVNLKDYEDPKSDRLYTGGGTPLHWAAQRVGSPRLKAEKQEEFADIVAYLLAHPDINVNAQDNSLATPLHKALGQLLPKKEAKEVVTALVSPEPIIPSEKDNEDVMDVVRQLLEKGADVNVADIQGMTPLHWAAVRGYPQVAELLIEFGAEVNKVNDLGMMPLHIAAQKGYIKLINLLLKAKADINKQDIRGRTPLLWTQRMREGAMYKGGSQMPKAHALKIIQLLLGSGADPTIKDKPDPAKGEDWQPRSALDWALLRPAPWSVGNPELKLLQKAAGRYAPTPTPTIAEPPVVSKRIIPVQTRYQADPWLEQYSQSLENWWQKPGYTKFLFILPYYYNPRTKHRYYIFGQRSNTWWGPVGEKTVSELNKAMDDIQKQLNISPLLGWSSPDILNHIKKYAYIKKGTHDSNKYIIFGVKFTEVDMVNVLKHFNYTTNEDKTMSNIAEVREDRLKDALNNMSPGTDFIDVLATVWKEGKRQYEGGQPRMYIRVDLAGILKEYFFGKR